MAFAQGSRHRASYVAETTFGTTPTTPSMKALRLTGTTFNLSKETYTSEEIRSDRQIVDLRHGTRQVGGDLSFELSYGAFDDLLESALFGVWTTDKVKSGTTLKSFTIERGFMDVGQYFRYTGCVVSSFGLSVPASGMVTGTMGLVGKGFAVSGPSLAVPAAAPAFAPMAAIGGALLVDNSPIASVTNLELSLENSVGPNFAVGQNETPELSYGRAAVTGTVSAHFSSLDLIEKFIDKVESRIEVQLVDDDGNQLNIEMPRIKYTGGDVPLNTEQSLQLNLPFQALLAEGAGTSLMITHIPAA
jgi:hypothetical protein